MEPTRDHKIIRNWALDRRAIPAVVRGENDGSPAVLKFIIPGAHYENRNLEAVSWEDFFAQFDLFGLSFVFQERTMSGAPSSMNEIVQVEPEVQDFRNWQ